jgi:hypothetical protein
MDITALTKIQNDIKEAEALQNKLGQEINEQTNRIVKLQQLLVKMCMHPTTAVRSNYSSGGYDYKSETRYIKECTICKKVLDIKVEYGYFQ